MLRKLLFGSLIASAVFLLSVPNPALAQDRHHQRHGGEYHRHDGQRYHRGHGNHRGYAHREGYRHHGRHVYKRHGSQRYYAGRYRRPGHYRNYGRHYYPGPDVRVVLPFPLLPPLPHHLILGLW